MKSQTNGRGCAACDAGPDHDRHSQSYWMPVASAVLFAAGLVMQYTGVEFFASSAVRFCWYLAAYFPVGLPVLITRSSSTGSAGRTEGEKRNWTEQYYFLI